MPTTCCNATAAASLCTWTATASARRRRAASGCAMSANWVRFAAALLDFEVPASLPRADIVVSATS